MWVKEKVIVRPKAELLQEKREDLFFICLQSRKVLYLHQLTAVSYTHLDVYKRQEAGGRVFRRVLGELCEKLPLNGTGRINIK